MFYVYILQSQEDASFYKGFTTDPVKRLYQHNNGESRYTRTKRPWQMVYLEECATKTAALKREISLKKANKGRILRLMDSPINILH